jgi:ABC-type Na+ efflux pump permease subunit
MTQNGHLLLKKLAYGTVGIVVLSLCAYFGYFAFYIARSDVFPAVRSGSLNVETSSLVLNILWEGNEIYMLLAAYLLLAGAFAYGAIRLFAAALGQR